MKSLSASVHVCAFYLILSLIGCTTAPTPQSTQSGGQPAVDHHPAPKPALDIPTYPFTYREGQQPMVAAHRGGGDVKGYPENCLESIRYLAQNRHVWMEIDLRETKDGHLILMHDASVDRTSDCQGRVEDMTYDELKQCRLMDNHGTQTAYHIPSLEDVLKWNAQSKATVLALDIKQNVDYDDVIHLVRKYDQMQYVYFIAYTIGQAKALRRKAPNGVISVTIRNQDELDRFMDAGLSTDKMMAFTGTIRSPKALYDQLHELGMMTIFGSMGNIDRQASRRGQQVYSQLYADGVDVLSSDRPLDVIE